MSRFLVALLSLALVAAAAASLAGLGPVVVNREGEYRVAYFLSTPTVLLRPGLALALPALPGLGRIERGDLRWQHLAAPARAVATKDQESIVLDSFVIWRVSDPVVLANAFSGRVSEAERQINQQVLGELRAVVGQHTLAEVLRDDRAGVLREISERSARAVAKFGIELRDVRINRTELPPDTEQNVYARMRSERERLGRKYRAEGDEAAQRIRAEADAEATVLLARARGAAETLRGEGDAQAARLVAEAAALDTEFYMYLRTLQAYRRTLGERTTIVLPPDHAFLRALQSGGEKR